MQNDERVFAGEARIFRRCKKTFVTLKSAYWDEILRYKGESHSLFYLLENQSLLMKKISLSDSLRLNLHFLKYVYNGNIG